jgi:UDP-2,4-diacetamido-2,4,6-trideoxy-beta-L-altropyranose hydrolase
MANKKVIIRVDGNSNIGLGHVYRGIALAEMLKDEFGVEFITRIDTTISPIKESGFDFIYIPEGVALLDEPNWVKANYSTDAIIVLDGYNFIETYQQKLKDLNYRLVYIDDLTQGTQKADLVINQSPGVKKSAYKAEKYTKFALGLNYALLRKSFIEFDREITKQKKEVKNVYISFGGSDYRDFSLKAVKVVLEINNIKTVNVVLGAAYQSKGIFDLHNSKLKIYKHLSEKEVFTVMKNSDLAIVPASTISIELASLGLPMILGYFTDNQIGIYKGFEKKNAVKGIGDFNDYKFENLKKEILDINIEEILIRIQKNLLNMFKGNVKDNIINKFKSLC